ACTSPARSPATASAASSTPAATRTRTRRGTRSSAGPSPTRATTEAPDVRRRGTPSLRPPAARRGGRHEFGVGDELGRDLDRPAPGRDLHAGGIGPEDLAERVGHPAG